MSSVGVTGEIQWIEEWRVTYRGKLNEFKGTVRTKLRGVIYWKWQEETNISEELHNENKYDVDRFEADEMNERHQKHCMKKDVWRIFGPRSYDLNQNFEEYTQNRYEQLTVIKKLEKKK